MGGAPLNAMSLFLNRAVLATCVATALVAARVHAHEGWGAMVHDQLGVVIADIPGTAAVVVVIAGLVGWRVRR